jgi:hypothetical protein
VGTGIMTWVGRHWDWLAAQGWAATVIFAMVVVSLVGILAALLALAVAAYRKPSRHQSGRAEDASLADRFSLRLLFRKGDVTPEFVAAENLFRYYTIEHGLHVVDTKSGEKSHHFAGRSLFVVYDAPVRKSNVRVRFGGEYPAAYEVKETSNRHAVIVFTEPLENRVVEVETY